VPRVRVPGIKWEATSRRVITMEWIDGVKLTDEKGELQYTAGLPLLLCRQRCHTHVNVNGGATVPPLC